MSDHLRAFVDEAPVPIAMFDREMRYIAASLRWIETMCPGEKGVIGRTHYEVVPEIPPHWKLMHERALAGETVRDDEGEFPRRDGRVQWIRREMRPWHNARGEIGGIIIAANDVTDLVEAQRALRESNAKLAAEKKATTGFYAIGLKVLRAQNLLEAIDIMLSGSIEMLGADMGIIQLLDGDGKLLRIVAQQGFKQDFRDFFYDISAAHDSASGRGLGTNKTAVIEDVELDAGYAPFRAAARVLGYRAVVAAPLVGRHGAQQGIMSLHYRSPHRPSDTDLEHLELYRHRGGDFIQRFKDEQALRESEERLAAILNAVPVGVGLFDKAGRFIFRNVALRGFTNELIPSLDNPALWRVFDSAGRRLGPDEFPAARVLRGEAPSETDVLTTVAGEERWIRVQAIPFLRDGKVAEGLCVAQDITQSKQADISLRESEERLRLAITSSRMGMWDWHVRTGKYFWNDENYRLFGYKAGEVEANRPMWAARVHPDDLQAAEAAAGTAQREHKDYFNEYRIIRPDGGVRWVRAQGRFLYQDEKPVRMIGLMEDITDARQQIETQRVLVAELQHRTRNLMAVVQSIAQQTLRTVGSLGEFEKRFDQRLEALSRVQGLLSRADNEPITLGTLVIMELDALGFGVADDRIKIGGPEAPLRKSAVEILSLAIHELLTNAIKYGALACKTGHLSVTWRVEGAPPRRRLVLEWIEHGIASLAPASNPTQNGYGRTLIEEGLPYSLSAETRFELGGDTLRCLISLPLTIGGMF